MAEARAVAERYYDGLRVNDLDRVIATIDSSCWAEVPGAVLEGPDQVRAWMKSFFDAFPDIRHTIGELDVDGRTVAADVHVTGTHTAPMVTPQGTIPPTGRPIEISARNAMEVGDESIVALRISYDAGAFMQQLGLA
jgi:predicted ester cyclase